MYLSNLLVQGFNYLELGVKSLLTKISFTLATPAYGHQLKKYSSAMQKLPE